MARILVSRPLVGTTLNRLREAGHEVVIMAEERSDAEFRAALPDFDGVLSLLSDPITAEMIGSAKRLKIISNYAVGYNNVDVAAATAAGILVTNTPDVLTDATADITMTLLLMALRAIPAGQRQLFEGRFGGWRPTGIMGHDPRGKNLGILGMGRIGLAVARRAEAFGMKILYHTRSGPREDLPWPHLSFKGLLAESDVLSLHCPLTDGTRHLLGENELRMMKPEATLINTARGPIIDEAALARVLKSGHLFAAGLDVYEREPQVHPDLMPLPNVVLLPHMGSSTIETRERMAALAVGALLDVFSGKPPRHPVNKV